MLVGFTGEYLVKMDGKGRMSIPSDLRPALSEGDSASTAQGKPPGVYVLYGPHLKGRLAAQTVEEFTRVAEAISTLRPRNQEEAAAKRLAQVSILGHALRLDLERDGRILMPQRQREKLGLADGGDLFVIGLGDTFEIWPSDGYAAMTGDLSAQFAELGPHHDPMAAVWSMQGTGQGAGQGAG